MWIIGDNTRPYKWNGTGWDIKPGAGIRISVDENDVPCMVGTDKNVYFWKDNAWELSRAGAIDIGSGGNQTWKVGDNFAVYQLVENKWKRIDGIAANAIDVNHLGTPWIVGTGTLNRQVYKRK